MDIKIIGTNQMTKLNLIDPATKISWIRGLMGNHGALPQYDEDNDYYLMSQADYDWWYDLVTRYQAADDRYHDLRRSLCGLQYDKLVSAADDIDVDLEDYPSALNQVCDRFE